MRRVTIPAVVAAAFIAGAACGTVTIGPSPAAGESVPGTVQPARAPTGPAGWHGFATGDVIVCPGGTVETDDYAPGDDPAMPDGGTWAHCDGPTYGGTTATD